jgi:hypothetical protein
MAGSQRRFGGMKKERILAAARQRSLSDTSWARKTAERIYVLPPPDGGGEQRAAAG